MRLNEHNTLIKLLTSGCACLVFYSCQLTQEFKYSSVKLDDEKRIQTEHFATIVKSRNKMVLATDNNKSIFSISRANGQYFYTLNDESEAFNNQELIFTTQNDTIETLDYFEHNHLPLTIRWKRCFLKDSFFIRNKEVHQIMIFKSWGGKKTLQNHFQVETIDYIDKKLVLPIRRDYSFYSISGEIQKSKCYSIYLNSVRNRLR